MFPPSVFTKVIMTIACSSPYHSDVFLHHKSNLMAAHIIMMCVTYCNIISDLCMLTSVPSKFIKSIQSHQAFSLVDNTTESGIRIGRALAQRSCNQSHITRTSRQASIYKFISIDSSENGQHVVKQSGGQSLFRLATDTNQEHYSTSIANSNST